MDRGAWQATVYRITQSQILLKQLSTQHRQIVPAIGPGEELIVGPMNLAGFCRTAMRGCYEDGVPGVGWHGRICFGTGGCTVRSGPLVG